MKINVYALIDDENNVVAKGTDFELRKQFNSVTRFSSYESNQTKYLKKYKVVKCGVKEQNIKYNRKYVVKEKKDNTMSYLVEHLQRYGNTVFAKKNPEHYLELLKKEGIKCNARTVADFDGKKTTYYYIFEVA